MPFKFRMSAVIIMAAMLLFTGACKSAPAITHPVADISDASCLVCHKDGLNKAPITKHSKYENCMRCHHEASGRETGQDGK